VALPAPHRAPCVASPLRQVPSSSSPLGERRLMTTYPLCVHAVGSFRRAAETLQPAVALSLRRHGEHILHGHATALEARCPCTCTHHPGRDPCPDALAAAPRTRLPEARVRMRAKPWPKALPWLCTAAAAVTPRPRPRRDIVATNTCLVLTTSWAWSPSCRRCTVATSTHAPAAALEHAHGRTHPRRFREHTIACCGRRAHRRATTLGC